MHRICPRRGGGLGAARPAFSLIELVIVVVITGLIAAIAIPRLTRGGEASGAAALAANLESLRKAIELYRADHGAYPTCVEVSGNKTSVMFQLTQYTDAAGNHSATRTATHRFGPYLRQIPRLGVGDRQDRTKINTADGSGVGWVYDPTTGSINANPPAGASDAKGRSYSSY